MRKSPVHRWSGKNLWWLGSVCCGSRSRRSSSRATPESIKSGSKQHGTSTACRMCGSRPSHPSRHLDQGVSASRPTRAVSSHFSVGKGGRLERRDQERYGKSEEPSPRTSAGDGDGKTVPNAWDHSHVNTAHDDDGPVSRNCLPTGASASTIGNGWKPPRGTTASSATWRWRTVSMTVSASQAVSKGALQPCSLARTLLR